MSRYATISRLTFEPKAEGVPLDAVAVAYTTPAVLRERLYNLALVSGARASVRALVRNDSTGGKAVLRLTDGVHVAFEQEITLNGADVSISQPADISGYRGSEALRWELDVTEVGSAGAVAELVADLTIETPLFIAVGQC